MNAEPLNLSFSDRLSSKTSQRALNGDRWAIILAGGDGTRLRSLTRAIAGDDRPKQFCPILRNETLLDQTRRRVSLAIPADQTLLSLTETHKAITSLWLRISQRRIWWCNRATWELRPRFFTAYYVLPC